MHRGPEELAPSRFLSVDARGVTCVKQGAHVSVVVSRCGSFTENAGSFLDFVPVDVVRFLFSQVFTASCVSRSTRTTDRTVACKHVVSSVRSETSRRSSPPEDREYLTFYSKDVLGRCAWNEQSFSKATRSIGHGLPVAALITRRR